MIISISNAIPATEILFAILFLIWLLSVRRNKPDNWFPASVTAELKGLAILVIVFSHIGYFLVTDHRFLWPLSTMSGIGVNLFLFLSGLGLTASQLRQPLSPWQFYRKRLSKLYIPFWLMIITFLVADFFVLHITRSFGYSLAALFGIFTHADLYADINSPLWYLTFILGYYLLFPWIFSKRRPWLSALGLYLIGWLIMWWNPAFLSNVLYLYRVHYVAFPLGILVYWATQELAARQPVSILEQWSRGRTAWIYYGALAVFAAIFLYANINSGVGHPVLEQTMSTVAVLIIAAIFIMKKVEFRLLSLFGLYSYEIYLWHWPIMYRYDFIYRFLPDNLIWVGVLLYLGVFLGWGYLMAKLADWLGSGRKTKAPAAITAKPAN